MSDHHLAEAATVEVVDSLADFSLTGHDEWAIADHRFVDWLAGQPQQGRIAVCLDIYTTASAVEMHQLPFAHHFTAVNQHCAVQHDQRQRVAFLCFEAADSTLADAYVPHIYGCEGLRRTAMSVELARDHTHLAYTFGQVH